MRRAFLLLALVCGAVRAPAVAGDLEGEWVTPDVLRAMERADARTKRARERLWRRAMREEAVERGTVAGVAVPGRPGQPERAAALERLEAMAEEPGPPLPEAGGVPVATATTPARIGPPASQRPADVHPAVREFRGMRSTRDGAESQDIETQPAHEFLQSMAETTTAPAIVARIQSRRAPPAPVSAPRPPPAPMPAELYGTLNRGLVARSGRSATAPAVLAAVLASAPRSPAVAPPAFVAESARAQQRALGAPRPKTRPTRGSVFDWRERDHKTKGRRSLDGDEL